MGVPQDEFPLLAEYGLYAADTAGNGNCLFHALSDQLTGSQSSHQEIRARVIEYMREHADFYKQFIDVRSGGGVRRNPKRKNAGGYSSPVNQTPPTPQEIDAFFESHLQSMAKGGTYGDNMEVVAFSAAYKVNVNIHQRDFSYMVSGTDNMEDIDNTDRRVLYIAYHTWEHYSSIRNIKGPHNGLPNISLASEGGKGGKVDFRNASCVKPWMIKIVMASLPYLADRATIHKVIEECKGNTDDAITKLLDLEERGSVSSAQGSSSVEREVESDDEYNSGPNKKQDRRLSRATRALKGKEAKDHDLTFRPKTHAHPPSSGPSPLQKKPVVNRSSVDEVGESEDEAWTPDPTHVDSGSDSDVAPEDTAPKKPKAGGVRLKLTQPKPEVEHSIRPPSLERSQYPGPDNRTGAGRGGRTQQRPSSPKPKRITAREKKEMKKLAQKAQAKARKQGINGDKAANNKNGSIATVLKDGKENSPAIDVGIKTLYI
ncbi:MAG: hypothetical protein MMC33_010641 [Icmadophila ericetorum]|nr:hypothetical protein [Icmadophila ericetorum]